MIKNMIKNQPDLMHTHLSIGLRPLNECPACDQTRVDLLFAKAVYRKSQRALLETAPSG